MQNNILDELIADYCGLNGAVGRYPAHWTLHFLGLENVETYRSGARLENYRVNLQMWSGAFGVLGRLLGAAIENLRLLNMATTSLACREKYRVVPTLTIASFTLEDLARPRACEQLVSRFRSWMASQNMLSALAN